MRLLYASDESCVMQLAASVRSVLDADPGVRNRLRVEVLAVDLTRRTQDLLQESWELSPAQVSFHSVDVENLTRLPKFPRAQISPAAYARLLVPDVVPDPSGRVIYLDCDTIVTGPLDPLWMHDLEGRAMAAVADPGVGTVSSPGGVAAWESLGMVCSDPYFNSGVMLLDLDRLLQLDFFTKAWAYIDEYAEKLTWADQEAINVAAYGEILSLSPIWNLMFHWYLPPLRDESKSLRELMVIRHFAGYFKPWSRGRRDVTRARRVEGEKLFFEALDHTAWSGWRPTT